VGPLADPDVQAALAGSPKVCLETVCPEGEGQDIGGLYKERVRTGTHPIGGDNHRRSLTRLLQYRPNITRIEERKVCGEHEERRGTEPQRPAAALFEGGVESAALLDER
jgi:hypothetical protein